MLLYLLNKKTQDIDALWQKIKNKYENTSLVASLEDYVSASGKKNHEERMLVAILLMESLGHMRCFNYECKTTDVKAPDPLGNEPTPAEDFEDELEEEVQEEVKEHHENNDSKPAAREYVCPCCGRRFSI